MPVRPRLLAGLLAVFIFVLATGPAQAQSSIDAVNKLLTECESKLKATDAAYDSSALHTGGEELSCWDEHVRTIGNCAKQLHDMGRNVIPILIDRLNNSHDPEPKSDGRSGYGAIAASNALSMFNTEMYGPALTAMSTHPSAKLLYANCFIASPDASVPFLGNCLVGADSQLSKTALQALITIMEGANISYEPVVAQTLDHNKVGAGIPLDLECCFFPAPLISWGNYYHYGHPQLMRLPHNAQRTLLQALSSAKIAKEQASIISLLALTDSPDDSAISAIRSALDRSSEQQPKHVELNGYRHRNAAGAPLDQSSPEHIGHAAATALGTIVFRDYARSVVRGGQRPSLSVKTLSSIEASLRTAAHSSGGYTCIAAWLSLCRLGACYPQGTALRDSLMATVRLAPSPRSLAVALMNANGWPTPKVVVPVLISVLLGDISNDGFTGKEQLNVNPRLRDALNKMDRKLGKQEAQTEAAQLLQKIDPQTLIACAAPFKNQLQGASTDPNPEVSSFCKNLLARMNP